MDSLLFCLYRQSHDTWPRASLRAPRGRGQTERAGRAHRPEQVPSPSPRKPSTVLHLRACLGVGARGRNNPEEGVRRQLGGRKGRAGLRSPRGLETTPHHLRAARLGRSPGLRFPAHPTHPLSFHLMAMRRFSDQCLQTCRAGHTVGSQEVMGNRIPVCVISISVAISPV